jgi:folate-binding protein YgfZ
MTLSPSPLQLHPWSWSDALPAGPRRLEQSVSLLRLEGPDTRRFLHGQSSQDLVLAPAGAWRRTCCISPTGRLRALAEVLVDGSGAWLLITAGDAAAVRTALDRVLFPADAVKLGPLQEALWLEPVGPDRPVAASPQATWEPLEAGEGWRLGPATVVPAGFAVPADLAALAPLPEPERQMRRIALGLPAAAAEINEETNPFELGLADRVSLAKGCYVGQETLARLATYDGVKQQLRRWFTPASPGSEKAAPRPGSTLRDVEGQRAGQVTSALALPGGEGWIGLALVRRAALEQEQLLCATNGADAAGGDATGADATAGAEAPAAGALQLQLSRPELFVAPPVGAGGG